MNKVNVAALIRSLQGINMFIDGKEVISTGNDFMSMHNTNIDLLKKIGPERETNYYEKRLPQYPEVFAIEIDELISRRNGSKQIRHFLGGGILKMIDTYKRIKKSEGRAVDDVRPKLEKIKQLNTNFISVLEKPGLEDLIEKVNSQ